MARKRSLKEIRQSIEESHNKLIQRRLKELEAEGEDFLKHLDSEKQFFPEHDFRDKQN